MRDLVELEFSSSHRPAVPPPTQEMISQLEREFGFNLPADYKVFLLQVNGGSPGLDAMDSGYCVDSFWALADKGNPLDQLRFHKTALSWCLPDCALPIANDGLAGEYFLDLSLDPAPVFMLQLRKGTAPIKIAESFGEFVDLLKRYDEDQ